MNRLPETRCHTQRPGRRGCDKKKGGWLVKQSAHMSFLVINGTVLDQNAFHDVIVPSIRSVRRNPGLERYEISQTGDRVMIIGVFADARSTQIHERIVQDLLHKHAAHVSLDEISYVNALPQTIDMAKSATGKVVSNFSSVGSVVPPNCQCKQYECAIL